MRLHQVLVGAREGDAITQISLNLRSVLNRLGPSDVFARHVDPTAAAHVRPISDLAEATSDGDIVILHVSIGDEVVWPAVEATSARIWIVYHNITPASFFADDPAFAEHLDLGRRQLNHLAPRIERVITVSEYNRRDLRDEGFDDVSVISSVLDPWRLCGLPSDPHFGRQVVARTPGPMILFVGQMLPHKRPDLLVGAHHLVTAHHEPEATLVLAGHHPSERFARQVSAYVDSLGLSERVWITGGVPDSRLAELYRRADVVVTASRHEGLCLPVLEAMAMSVPVVVSDHGALPETVAGCGIVVGDDAAEGFAEGIVMALEERDRAGRVLRGRARARCLDFETAADSIADQVRHWLDASP